MLSLSWLGIPIMDGEHPTSTKCIRSTNSVNYGFIFVIDYSGLRVTIQFVILHRSMCQKLFMHILFKLLSMVIFSSQRAWRSILG